MEKRELSVRVVSPFFFDKIEQWNILKFALFIKFWAQIVSNQRMCILLVLLVNAHQLACIMMKIN